MSKAVEEPKKPPSGYWLWLAENREGISKSASSTKGSVVAKLAGEKWAALPDEEKKPYLAKAEQAKADYVKAMDAFKASGGEPGARRREKAEAKKGRATKKARKAADEASGKPKKAMSAYFLWLNENREQNVKEAGTSNLGAVAKLAGEKWKGMSADQRKVYEDKAAKLKAEYEKEMAAWKAKQENGAANDDDASDDGSGDE